jgi:N-acyl-D-aspartate/D-glutamate deacylase
LRSTDRGRIRTGAHADVVIFDPTRIGSERVELRSDLPAGARRLYAGAVGMEHVLVAGSPVVENGRFLGTRPGNVLRSGRDTTGSSH